MIQLETYKGIKSRHTCPQCGKRREFTRFINTDTGEHLPDNVGICNRSSSCGYRYTAKQYFADNPTGSKFVKVRVSHGTQTVNEIVNRGLQTETKPFDFIAPEHLKATLGNYDRNNFVQFLFNLFPDASEEIQAVLKMYFVGTYEDYTCFPQIDRLNRVCKAKLMKFDSVTGSSKINGKRFISSLPAKLKLKEDFNYKQIFFGEHLLQRESLKPVAIVESEKTAILASLCMPRFVWLATGSKQWLKVEKLQRLDNRQIILYPDADGFDQWQSVATDAQRQGLNVKASALIENFATDQQKQNQYDLADYLINQQKEINELNEVYDAYNSKVELILNDESLFNGFNLFLDEQKAIAVYNGSTEAEAERICTRSENIRAVALSV